MSVETFKQARLLDLLHVNTESGVRWAVESDDLDCNLVSWKSGETVAAHVNAEVDVLIIILAGNGRLSVDGQWTDIMPGAATLITKNVSRSIVAGENGLAYVTVHKRRRRLMPGTAESRVASQLSLKKRQSS